MSADPNAPTREQTLARELQGWFERHGRPLPWRDDRTPYRVWVSEVMLQQTRAETVERYFDRFLERFPDVHALASADEQDVLKAWQGLGYYQRARRLHRAARIVAHELGGELPRSAAELSALPGFGPYTATAVAAFAFGTDRVAVDANVRRVGARWLGQERPDDASIAAAFTAVARHAPTPAAVAEALIEVGALVCAPRDPLCATCPLRADCVARAAGSPDAFPRPTPRRAPRDVRRTACLVMDASGIWLQRRPADGLLGGLWGVPQTDEDVEGAPLGCVRHAYTHLRLELAVVLVDPGPLPAALAAAPAAERVAWARLPDLPVSGADLKVLALARDRGALPPEAAAALHGRMPP